MTRTNFNSARAAVSMDFELGKTRKMFENIPDFRASNVVHRLSDVLMSGLAMFSLKYSSLLDFDEQTTLECENMKQVFGIQSVCSDTHFRRILDQQALRSAAQNT